MHTRINASAMSGTHITQNTKNFSLMSGNLFCIWKDLSNKYVSDYYAYSED